VLVGGVDEAGREPGCVEQAPEVVPRVREMRRLGVGVATAVLTERIRLAFEARLDEREPEAA